MISLNWGVLVGRRRRAREARRAVTGALWALITAAGLGPAAAAAQWVEVPSPHADALAQAVTALASPHAWQASGNPAATASATAPQLSAAVIEHALLPQLSRPAAMALLPWRGQTFGMAVTTVGLADYRETLWGLSYARQLGRLSVGTRLGGLSVNVPGFGARTIAQADIGLLAAVGKRRELHLGLRTANAHGARIGETDAQPLAGLVALGVGWQASKQVTLLAETQWREREEGRLHAALEYRPTDVVAIRVGAVPQRQRWHVGFGLNYRRLRLDLATRVDPILGWSPSVGIQYAFNPSTSPTNE